jgi:hypothetical protein
MRFPAGRGRGGEVVDIEDRRRGGSALHPALARLCDCWQGLRRRGSGPPDRAAVDPRALGEALEFAFLAVRVAPGDVRLRVAGRHPTGLLGCEARGMPLSALFLPEAREAAARGIESAFDRPAAVTMTLDSPAGPGRPRLGAGLLLLPLADRRGAVSHLLGGLAGEAEPVPAPRRFRLLTVHALPCPPSPPKGCGGAPAARPAPEGGRTARAGAAFLRLVHARP